MRTLLFLLLSPIVAFGQLTLIAPLEDSIKESSGLLYIAGRLITHNDSGNEPALYEVDSTTGNVLRKVVVGNASNTDWEDITADSTYIYIGDFGNNAGSRTDLRIYRVSIADYIANDTITADTINFSYADQTDFTPSTFTTNYDAEAIISLGDSLYVFTKNWGDNRTNVYALPKMPGTYSVPRFDSINAMGLVTGAVLNENRIVLTGYTVTVPITIELSGFPGHNFSSGIIDRNELTPVAGYSIQIEAIVATGQFSYYITAEGGFTGDAGLFELDLTPPPTGVGPAFDAEKWLLPSPVHDRIIINREHDRILVYDMNGILASRSSTGVLDVSSLAQGTYVVLVERGGMPAYSQLIIVQ